METNFFTAIADMSPTGTWIITISQVDYEKQVVSVLYKENPTKDEQTSLTPIQPLIFRATPQMIDKTFFVDLRQPIELQLEVLVNRSQFLKSITNSEKQDKPKQARDNGLLNGKSDKQKKYEGLLKKVDELEAEGKYREAWMKVPEISEYPENEVFLRKRREELSAKFPPSLFS